MTYLPTQVQGRWFYLYLIQASISARKRSPRVCFFFRSKASEAKVVCFMMVARVMPFVFFRL